MGTPASARKARAAAVAGIRGASRSGRLARWARSARASASGASSASAAAAEATSPYTATPASTQLACRGRLGIRRLHDEHSVGLGRCGGERLRGRDLFVRELRRVGAVSAEIAGEQDRVDVARPEQDAADVRVGREPALATAGEVDRIGEARGRREEASEGSSGRWREGRHLEPGGGEDVARDDPVAATVGVDGDAPPAATDDLRAAPGRRRSAASASRPGRSQPPRTPRRSPASR